MKVGREMANSVGKEAEMKPKLNLEETELRLGLPVQGSAGDTAKVVKSKSNGVNKRGFFETVDLKLKLPSQELIVNDQSKEEENSHHHNKEKSYLPNANDPAMPPPKAQAVGWPPVRSFRKKILAVQKVSSNETRHHEKLKDSNNSNATFVKVSVDGAPYLRKLDLKMYSSYHQLSDALGKMFTSFTTIGVFGSEETMKGFMSGIKLKDVLNGADYVPTYEDKDGDWMLVGDVPWWMFVGSCKRLRIMRGKEATLAENRVD